MYDYIKNYNDQRALYHFIFHYMIATTTKSYFVACIIYIYSKFIKNYAMANPDAYMFWSFHPNILIKIFENQKEKHRFLHMHYYFIFQCINKFRMLICQSILIIVFKLLNLWNKKWSLNKVHIFFNSFF